MFKFLKNALLLIALVLIALPWALPADSFFLPPEADMLARVGYAIIAAFVIVSLFKHEPVIETPAPKTEYLLGTPELVTLYQAYEQYSGCSKNVFGYYSTSENAFAVHPKASVCPIEIYKVGDHYIENIKARLMDLTVDRDVPKSKELTA